MKFHKDILSRSNTVLALVKISAKDVEHQSSIGAAKPQHNVQTIYEHIFKVEQNCIYISPKIQNRFLNVIFASLVKSIDAVVKQAHSFF